MELDVSVGAAIFAGALSFLSPCVLPLVPPYLCYISGLSLDDLAGEEVKVETHHRMRVMLAALCFRPRLHHGVRAARRHGLCRRPDAAARCC
jgi:cytochrome c-type biogenesis protein